MSVELVIIIMAIWDVEFQVQGDKLGKSESICTGGPCILWFLVPKGIRVITDYGRPERK